MFVIIPAVIFLIFLAERIIRSFKVDGFAQKYIFITGCDSGFGQRLAIRLDSLGFPVFAACFTDAGQKFLSENASSRLATLSLDVTKTEDIKKALDFVKGKLPPETGLWAIVNNAGIPGPLVPLEMCPPDEFVKTMAVNVLGPIEICRKFIPLVRMCKGRVVNVSSIAGRIALSRSPYNTSKFAMEGFSDSLRQEVYPQGIKVSIIEPGLFSTGCSNKEELMKNIERVYDLADESVKEKYSNYIEYASLSIDHINQTRSTNFDIVLDAYTHAIVSRVPKTRYVAGGWVASFIIIPLSFMPAAFSCWLICTFKRHMIKTKL